MPRPGNVLGLVGTNGIGKSTALKILSGKLKPNLGRHDNPPDCKQKSTFEIALYPCLVHVAIPVSLIRKQYFHTLEESWVTAKST